MKIIGTSDWHGQLPDLPKCDLLLIAGDILPDYTEEGQREWFYNSFLPHVAEIAPEVLATWGNHDFWPEREGPQTGSWEIGGARIRVEVDRMVVIGGLKIWCSPWTINLPGWAWQKTEGDLTESLRDVEADILLSHQPPLGQGDEVMPGYHLGSRAIRDWHQRNPESLVVCGHIHEDFGRHGNVYSCAWVDEEYKARNRWLEISPTVASAAPVPAGGSAS